MMCGIIGIVATKSSFPLDKFKALLQEAKIRGLHATGLAFVDSGKLVCERQATSAETFKFPEAVAKKSTRVAIAHTRYSTSDLKFNQPIFSPTKAVILNGVISQADPSEWKKLFGVECEGRNDAEIVLRLLEKQEHPLSVVDSSQACIYVDTELNELKFWRNEQRPLYWLETEDCLIVASTKDIFKRAGFKQAPSNCTPCVEYGINLQSFKRTSQIIRKANEDLQNV
jgi:asparagine synthetase B (glutamine-hydrolysing)